MWFKIRRIIHPSNLIESNRNSYNPFLTTSIPTGQHVDVVVTCPPAAAARIDDTRFSDLTQRFKSNKAYIRK